MTSVSKLAELFRALSREDLSGAKRIAEGITQSEELAGRFGVAARLRGAMARTGPVREALAAAARLEAALPLRADDLVTELAPAALEAVALRPKLRTDLAHLLQELLEEARLARHGLRPRRRVLFHGPPGCGKTLTARAIGGALGWPVFVVRFDALLSSFLGQTGLRVRELFRFAEGVRCVLLLDELDALGRTRGATNDVAELDRVVIALMQQLDLVQPAGLLIAATNLGHRLDPALLRRFELTMKFPTPTRAELADFAKRGAAARGLQLPALRRSLAAQKTYADVERLLEDRHRRAVLGEKQKAGLRGPKSGARAPQPVHAR